METQLSAIDHFTSIHHHASIFVIRVRAVAVWTIPFSLITMNPCCLNMILMDRMGTKIQASVCRKHPITRTIQAGRVYRISKFRVILNEGTRFTSHDFKLIFHSCNNIAESFDVRIPQRGCSFFDTQVIRARADEFQHLIEFVGVVSAASSEKIIMKNGQMTSMMAIDFQDARGKIRCILIGSLVNSMSNFLASSWTVRPIVVLQFVKVKSYRDKFVMEGVPIASRVYFNPDIDEVNELTQRMSVLGCNYHGPVGYIRPHDSNLNLKDNMLYTHPRKTLPQLLDTKEVGTFIVRACIAGVLRDDDWSYPACRCFSELRTNGLNYDCLKCGRRIGQMIKRFRVKVEVYDGLDSAVCSLFDREVEQVAGFSCEELINTIEVEKRLIPEGEYPDEIESNLAGHELLFKVRNNCGIYYGKYECFEVLKICTDLEIIAMFNQHDLVTAPIKDNFMPSFQQTGEDKDVDENTSNLQGKALLSAESESVEQTVASPRSKLGIDFASDAGKFQEDANKDDAEISNKKLDSQVMDGVEDGYSVDNEPESITAVSVNCSSKPADHVMDAGRVAGQGRLNSAVSEVKILVKWGAVDVHASGAETEPQAISGSGVFEGESSAEENMMDNLDMRGMKSKTVAKGAGNGHKKSIGKHGVVKEVVVISDDDEGIA